MGDDDRFVEFDNNNRWSVAAEEFMAQIHRSSELLSQNRGEDARKLLESAFESRMDDPSGQAALGLVYFKLGIYPRAAAIYQRLLKDYPKEPTLRLNLGLVYLKTGQVESAVRELKTAANLVPNYKRAHKYLGLAYRQLGDYAKAKCAFEKAGAERSALQMQRLLDADNSLQKDLSLTIGTIDLSADSKLGCTRNSRLFSDLSLYFPELPFSTTPPSSDSIDSSLLPNQPFTHSETVPFSINETGFLTIEISDRLFSRLYGLHFLTASRLSYEPIKRRYRREERNELLGGQDSPIYEISGSGRLVFVSNGKVFSIVRLDDDAAFVREDFLFAMESSLDFENGYMPGDGSMLTHIRGKGRIVLQTPGKPSVLEITPSVGAVIPQKDIIGWFGCITSKKKSDSPLPPNLDAVEITGEGAVLLCLQDYL